MLRAYDCPKFALLHIRYALCRSKMRAINNTVYSFAHCHQAMLLYLEQMCLDEELSFGEMSDLFQVLCGIQFFGIQGSIQKVKGVINRRSFRRQFQLLRRHARRRDANFIDRFGGRSSAVAVAATVVAIGGFRRRVREPRFNFGNGSICRRTIAFQLQFGARV